MRLLAVILLSFGVACGPEPRTLGDAPDAGENSDGPGEQDAGGTPDGFQSFAPATRSLGLAGDRFQLSLTSGTGAIACGLSKDHSNSLGGAGHQVIADIAYAAGYPCPTGSYSVPSTCNVESLEQSWRASVPDRCAFYRRWDAQGDVETVVAATAGALTISGDDEACVVAVELSFAGTIFSDSFTLTNGLVADPWCR